MAKIAVIGDTTSVAGFRALGFEVLVADRPEDARGMLGGLVNGEYAVVFVTEPVYAAIAEQVAEYSDRALPAITVVPAVDSAGGVGGAKLERAIERALGTKLPGDEDNG